MENSLAAAENSSTRGIWDYWKTCQPYKTRYYILNEPLLCHLNRKRNQNELPRDINWIQLFSVHTFIDLRIMQSELYDMNTSETKKRTSKGNI